MTPEKRDIPEWTHHERDEDLDWIREDADIFNFAARLAYESVGRGAIVVDTTSQPQRGLLFGYLSQEQIEELADEDTGRMVCEYNPEREFVLVLLKPENRSSTYRVQSQRPGR